VAKQEFTVPAYRLPPLAADHRREPRDGNERLIGPARQIGATDVEIVVFLAETEITIGDLLTLQPGDILQTTKPASSEHVMLIENEKKFSGRLGCHKDHVAIKITRRAEVEEPL
jgi:flagellar motor switch protein FliM